MTAFHAEEVGVADDSFGPRAGLAEFDDRLRFAGGIVPEFLGCERGDVERFAFVGDDEMVGVGGAPGFGLGEAEAHDEVGIGRGVEDELCLGVGVERGWRGLSGGDGRAESR